MIILQQTILNYGQLIAIRIWGWSELKSDERLLGVHQVVFYFAILPKISSNFFC